MKCLLDHNALDIIALAETKRNNDHPVIELHNDYQWIGKNRVSGNGGGVGFMINTKKVSVLEDNLLSSQTDEIERLWISVKVNKFNLAVGVVYFPVDNQSTTREAAFELNNELIQNIATLQNEFDNVVLLGDFNGRAMEFRSAGLTSSNGQHVDDLVSATNMILLNATDKCSGSITWSRNAQQSTIDYALCSEQMMEHVLSVLVDEEHLYSLGSDHNVILVKTNIMSINTSKPPATPAIKKWNLKTGTDWSKFQDKIQDVFTNWANTNHDDADDMWLDFKSRVLSAASETVGNKTYKNKCTYWDKEVAHLIQDRKKANRLYRVWSRHPNCSPELLTILWDDYMDKKKKVAEKVKYNMVIHKTKVIMQNASKATSNPRAFWNMLSRFNKASNYPLRIRDPVNPDVIIEDPKAIRKALTSYWSGLGKGTNTDTHREDDISAIGMQPPHADSLHSIILTMDTVTAAISKLKTNKATGTDNIPAEFLKYGGSVIHRALLDLFTKIKLLEVIPEQWYEGIVKPLLKEGNKEMLNNYRGITISSIVYKTFVAIIENQVTDFVEVNKLLGDYQGAFRRDRQCEDHIFSLKGICSVRKSKKNKTYLAFLDVSKAFDTVDRQMLFKHLWDLGIQGKAWKLLRALYTKVSNKVIFGQFESDMYEVINGVKQGCVMSPSLFNLVVADLDHMLIGTGGVQVGSGRVHGLYYADDIVLLAETNNVLQDMLNICDSFAQKWNLKYNEKKSKAMVIGQKFRNEQWQLGDKTISSIKNYKYLGVIITCSLKDTSHINQHLETKFSNLQSYIRFTLSKHMDIKRTYFGNTIWHKAVLPSLAHASGTWFSSSLTAQRKISSIQYKLAKAVLKLKCMPSRVATLAELGWLPINEHLNIKRISFYQRLLQMDEHRLPKIVYNELLQIHQNGKSGAFDYAGRIKQILEDKGLDYMFDNADSLCTQTFKKLTSICYANQFQFDIGELSSLQHYRIVKQDTCMSQYLDSAQSFSAIQLKFKLRTGVSGIGEDMLRQHRGLGTCSSCSCGEFESLKHYVFKCTAFSTQRLKMFDKLKVLCDTSSFNMFLTDTNYALYMVLGDCDDVFNKCFLEYLKDTWPERRK